MICGNKGTEFGHVRGLGVIRGGEYLGVETEALVHLRFSVKQELPAQVLALADLAMALDGSSEVAAVLLSAVSLWRRRVKLSI
jgi:hypothetical protein